VGYDFFYPLVRRGKESRKSGKINEVSSLFFFFLLLNFGKAANVELLNDKNK
jgi:hypothetical protein